MNEIWVHVLLGYRTEPPKSKIGKFFDKIFGFSSMVVPMSKNFIYDLDDITNMTMNVVDKYNGNISAYEALEIALWNANHKEQGCCAMSLVAISFNRKHANSVINHLSRNGYAKDFNSCKLNSDTYLMSAWDKWEDHIFKVYRNKHDRMLYKHPDFCVTS